ncbi:MAG: hypothetical protein PHX82_12945 [Paracoccaceae bacterium]|jgi:hypothetical protein|nr:hypothetical protein [Paracoccaceae bacterium]
MPLTHFLILICAVLLAGGVTLWLAASAGVPLTALAVCALLAAGVMRLLARVE